MSTRPAKKQNVSEEVPVGLEEKFKRWVAQNVKEQPEAAFIKIFGDGNIVVSTAAGVAHRARRDKDAHDWFDAVLAAEAKAQSTSDPTEPISD